MYGPITTLRRDNQPVKHIPWTAFKLSDRDWHRVIDARDILEVHIPCSLFGYWELIKTQDSNLIQQYFSSETQPTLWHALPTLEELQSSWEKKSDTPKYMLYKDALTDGLTSGKR